MSWTLDWLPSNHSAVPSFALTAGQLPSFYRTLRFPILPHPHIHPPSSRLCTLTSSHLSIAPHLWFTVSHLTKQIASLFCGMFLQCSLQTLPACQVTSSCFLLQFSVHCHSTLCPLNTPILSHCDAGDKSFQSPIHWPGEPGVRAAAIQIICVFSWNGSTKCYMFWSIDCRDGDLATAIIQYPLLLVSLWMTRVANNNLVQSRYY